MAPRVPKPRVCDSSRCAVQSAGGAARLMGAGADHTEPASTFVSVRNSDRGVPESAARAAPCHGKRRESKRRESSRSCSRVKDRDAHADSGNGSSQHNTKDTGERITKTGTWFLARAVLQRQARNGRGDVDATGDRGLCTRNRQLCIERAGILLRHQNGRDRIFFAFCRYLV
jgi:hypothetical protein